MKSTLECLRTHGGLPVNEIVSLTKLTEKDVRKQLKKLKAQHAAQYDKQLKVWKAQPTALGCNIFAGGFAIGVSKHFNILAHFEESNYFVGTFKHNFPWVPAWMNIVTWPRERFAGRVDFCYNNPPCAPWSPTGVTIARGSDAWKTDPRVRCVRNSFSLLEDLRPKVWLWESVPRAASPNGGRALVLELIEKAKELGYSATELFNAAWMHRIPQRRRRFMLLLHNIELELPEPEPHIMLVREAIEHLDPQEPVYWLNAEKRALYEDTPQGGSLRTTFTRWNPETADQRQVAGRPPIMEWRMHYDALGGVITSMNSQLHPEEPRYLAWNEVHALCQYPEDWEWQGPVSSWRTQMAQAVLPNVAEYVAKCVAASLERNVPKPEWSHETVDWTKNHTPPKPE